MIEMSADRAEIGFALHSNLIMLKCLVNGVEQDFLLDTGASQTLLATASAERLGVEFQGECDDAIGAGGMVAASLTTIGRLTVGEATVRDLAVAIIDISAICEQIGRTIDGVLGFNFLSQFKVTLDYQKCLLTLEPNPTATTS